MIFIDFMIHLYDFKGKLIRCKTLCNFSVEWFIDCTRAITEDCKLGIHQSYVWSPGGSSKKIRTGMLKEKFKISTISIPFFCKKHPIWGKLGAFLAKFSKIHPILQIGRIGYVTITHPSINQNLRKYTSKPLSIPIYHLSVRTPWGLKSNCLLQMNPFWPVVA